ncbi:hypothetical protein OWR29_19040 [Actinoplanes sp. Pm04-4]|uniref:Uncharacterized protein n=1 Tax=Paractinoplanes pyxinae TaxID=2997416 RepID=A0ABT4B0S7_9ACTN|nr:hypothetical protein [Actinoplanes pyxinae]MCY1140104.1 hypothetical protein [Actinoplanes pyxinae]
MLLGADLDRKQLADLAGSAGRRLLLREEAIFERRSSEAPHAPTPAPVAAGAAFASPAPPTQLSPEEKSADTSPGGIEGFDYTKTDRYQADQLLDADDLEGLERLALWSGDKYVRMSLALLYERRGDRQAVRELATFSRRTGRHLVERLAEEGNLAELIRMILCGDGFALRAIRNWDVAGLDNDLRNRILTNGLTPDGRIADAS